MMSTASAEMECLRQCAETADTTTFECRGPSGYEHSLPGGARSGFEEFVSKVSRGPFPIQYGDFVARSPIPSGVLEPFWQTRQRCGLLRRSPKSPLSVVRTKSAFTEWQWLSPSHCLLFSQGVHWAGRPCIVHRLSSFSRTDHVSTAMDSPFIATQMDADTSA